jgi:signal transduction histidine kinase
MGRTRLILISTLAIVLGVGVFGAVLLSRFWSASVHLIAEREALFAESRAHLISAELTRIEKAIGRLSRVAEIDMADNDLEPEKRFLHVAKESALFAMTVAVIDDAGSVLWAEPSAPRSDLPWRSVVRDSMDGQVHTTLAEGRILISSALHGGGALVGIIDPSTPQFLGPNIGQYLGHAGLLRLMDESNRLVAAVGPTAASTSQSASSPAQATMAKREASWVSLSAPAGAGQRWVTDDNGRRWLRTVTPVGFLGLQMDLIQPLDEIDAPLARPFRSLVAIVAIELLAAVAAGGLLARALGRLHDVERELSRAEQLAAMGRTAAAIAHELKNALNGLSVAVDLVVFGSAPPDKATGIRAQIRSEMERLRRITDDLTFFSGPARLELAPVDLRDLLGRVPSVLADRIVDEAITIEMDLTPDEEGGTSLQVNGDAHRLLGVLVNLGHNAIDAMRPTAFAPPDGEPPPERPRRLRIAARALNGQAELEFTDTGAGIAQEVRATMFEPFVTTKRTGTGLGLAIARKVVEAHGGRITAASTSETGTTFLIQLPLGRRRP